MNTLEKLVMIGALGLGGCTQQLENNQEHYAFTTPLLEIISPPRLQGDTPLRHADAQFGYSFRVRRDTPFTAGFIEYNGRLVPGLFEEATQHSIEDEGWKYFSLGLDAPFSPGKYHLLKINLTLSDGRNVAEQVTWMDEPLPH